MFPNKGLIQVQSKLTFKPSETFPPTPQPISHGRLDLNRSSNRNNACLSSLLILMICINHLTPTYQLRATSSTSKPQLVRRVSVNYSPNNRGTLSNFTVHSSRAQNSFWIPIAMPKKPQPHLKATQVASFVPTSGGASAKQITTTTFQKSNLKDFPTATESTQLHLKSNSLYEAPLEQNSQQSLRNSVYGHQPHISFERYSNSNPRFHHHNRNTRWRTPRYNEPQPTTASKMYKRVLLCDKTLVSLDYVRSFELEPRPFKHHSYDSEFLNDNYIDLDDATLASNTFMSSRQLPPLAPNKTASSIATAGTSTSVPEIASSHSSISRRFMGRKSFLTDEDPLVKCDMWDLEKGLKNRKPPREILKMAVRADFDTVRDAINRCRQLTEKTLASDDEYRDGLEVMSTEDLVSLFSMKKGLIPGTKWCGLGDQASTYNDLGPKHRIDVCCRAHDHCPIRLKPFRNDYGVLNIALYTKSHCDCDADFYRCLREVHSRTADMLGNLYFNVMKLQCLREERMKICREMKHIALGFERCVKYEESPVKTIFKFTTPPVAY